MQLYRLKRFTPHPLANTRTPTSRGLFSHVAITAQILFTYIFRALSVASYSYIQLGELGQCGENEIGQASKLQQGIKLDRVRCSIVGWATVIINVILPIVYMCIYSAMWPVPRHRYIFNDNPHILAPNSCATERQFTNWITHADFRASITGNLSKINRQASCLSM